MKEKPIVKFVLSATATFKTHSLACDEIEAFDHGIAGLRAGEICGVVAAPPGRKALVERGPQIVGNRHEFEVPGGRQSVGGHDPPSAGGRENEDVGPARAGVGGETRGDLERLFDRGSAGEAGLAVHGLPDPLSGVDHDLVNLLLALPHRGSGALSQGDGGGDADVSLFIRRVLPEKRFGGAGPEDETLEK